MSDKYIIKNCPCRMELHENDCFGHTGYNNCCACPDCLLKQIVELCEQYKKDYSTTNGVWLLAANIANLLDIQEVK